MRAFWSLFIVVVAISTAATEHGGWAMLFGILILIDTSVDIMDLINKRADEILVEIRKRSSV